MPKAKVKQTPMEKELSALAAKRNKALEGLSRRDRLKMVEISDKFHKDCEVVRQKHKDSDEEKAAAIVKQEEAKKIADAKRADNDAARKQDKK